MVKMENRIQIKILGHLDKHWETNFQGMKISYDDRHTVLTGTVKDEAQKFGLLNMIRDFNLKLISIKPIEENDNNSI